MKSSQKELWKKFAIGFAFLAVLFFAMADLEPLFIILGMGDL
jgi:hypothetical protein